MGTLDISPVAPLWPTNERTAARAPSQTPPVVESQDSSPPQAAAVPRAELDAAVTRLQEVASQHYPNLHFAVDEASGKTVVHVIDKNSGEVIRQIPSEAALRAAAKSGEQDPSLLVDMLI